MVGSTYAVLTIRKDTVRATSVFTDMVSSGASSVAGGATPDVSYIIGGASSKTFNMAERAIGLSKFNVVNLVIGRGEAATRHTAADGMTNTASERGSAAID